MPRTYDVFCRVIDNYGDIGVCWRLTRQLAARADTAAVRLWVDDLGAFSRIAPAVRPTAIQHVDSVQIRHWTAESAIGVEPAHVVIEAFACTPPPEYVDRMSDQHLWINLEYLSAEEWVESCHGLPSLQPDSRRKYFFFPGFTERTGGLLREPSLISQRDAWQADSQQRLALLRDLGVSPVWLDRLQTGARLIYMFCYAQAPVPALLRVLRRLPGHTLVLLADGVYPHTAVNTDPEKSTLALHRHPFVDQHTFDRLLWSADLNLVRGEDSLVRAIWAGRPMLWQAYPQAEATHLDKLEAWLERTPYDADVRALARAWNQGEEEVLNDLLPQMMQPPRRGLWETQAHAWCAALESHSSLVDKLADFCAEHSQTR